MFNPGDTRNVDMSSVYVTADAMATAYVSSNYLYDWQLWEHTFRDWFYFEWEQFYAGGGSPAPSGPAVSGAVSGIALSTLRKPSCRGLFGNGADPAQVLHEALAGTSTAVSAINFVNLGPNAAVAVTTTDPAVWDQKMTQQWVVRSAHIDINTSGPWFTGWANDRAVYGNYTDDQFAAATLIHELGEVFSLVSFMGGFLVPPHPASDASSWDTEIFKACFGAP